MLIEEITNDKASKIIGKIDTLVLPVGTIEAHGPHCSVASDIIVPVRLCMEVEKLAGDRVFVAPIIPYGHTWHLKDRAGSHDVPASVFSDYVFEVLRGFLNEWKIKYAVIVNGHGGNDHALALAAERIASLGLKTVILDWWSGAFLEALREVIPEPEGHGGEGETSLVWNVGEKYVDSSIIPKEDNVRSYDKSRTIAAFSDTFDIDANRSFFPRAFSGRPSKASPEKGKALNERAAKLIVSVIDELRAGTLSRP